MREEELIKKLQGVELPGIEMRSHRRRLRMALFNAYHQRQREVGIWGLAKSKVKGGIDTMIQGLISRQPLWKTAIATVLVVAIIAGLAIALPALIGQLPQALAAKIVRNSSEVRDALDGEPVVEVSILKRDRDNAMVLVKGKGRYAIANVNLEAREVIKVFLIGFPEFSDEEKARAIEIAQADPRVQELLDKGGTVDEVISFPIGPAIIKLDPEEPVKEVIEDDRLPAVVIVLDNQRWMVLVDLDKGEVDRILQPGIAPNRPIEVPIRAELKKTEVVGPPITPITEPEKEEGINIAKADPRFQELLDKGAEIVKVSRRFTFSKVGEAEEEWTVSFGPVSQDKVLVILELPGVELWATVVVVDLVEGRVVSITPVP